MIIPAIERDKHAVKGYVSDHGLQRLVTRSEVGLLQDALAAQGLSRVIALTTLHYLASPAVMSQSDMAAPLPRRLAGAFAEQCHLKSPYLFRDYGLMAPRPWQRVCSRLAARRIAGSSGRAAAE
ncbi:MAG: hypothetical protein J2P48_17345 [Alphaproteobacteria bacterium]|nr:hypothetical protein [Alphaproteobacteria bacterium]